MQSPPSSTSPTFPSRSRRISDSLRTTASSSERNTVILSVLGLIPPKRRTLSSSSSFENEGPRGQQEVELTRASKYENEVRSKLRSDDQRIQDAASFSLLLGTSDIASIPQGAVVAQEEEQEEFSYPSLLSSPPPPPLQPSLNPYATPFHARPKPPPPEPSLSSTNQVGNLIDFGDDESTWFLSAPPLPPPPPVSLFVPSWLSETPVAQSPSGEGEWWDQAPPFVPSHQRAAVPLLSPASPSTQPFASPPPFSPPPSSFSTIPTNVPSSSSSSSPPPLCEILVGNLSPATGPSAISSLFSDFGVVRDVRFVKDPSTGIRKGWAIVVLSTDGDVYQLRRNAGRAVEGLHGREVHGRRWKVEWADSTEEGSGSTRARTGTAEQRPSFSQARSQVELDWQKEAQDPQKSSTKEPQPRRSSTFHISSPPNDRLAAPNWREAVRAEEGSRKLDLFRRRTEDTTFWRSSSSDLPAATDPRVASSSPTFNASESLPTETNEPYESSGNGWDPEEDNSTPDSDPSNEEEQETGLGWGDESTPFEDEEEQRTEEERTPTPVLEPNRGRSDESTWTWDDTKQEEGLEADEEVELFDTEISWDDPPSTNGPRTTSFDWASEPVPPRRPNQFDEEPTPPPPPSSRDTPSTTGAKSSSSSFGTASLTPRSSTIFVNNLSSQTGEQGLAATFSLCGRVVRSRIPSDPMTGGSKGFGYVEFEREEQAELALREMEGVVIDGKRIRIEWSRPRKDEVSGGAEHDGVGGRAGGRDFEQQHQSTEMGHGGGDSFGGGRGLQRQQGQQPPLGYSCYGEGNAASFAKSRPFKTRPRRTQDYVPPPRFVPPPFFNYNDYQPTPTNSSFSLGPSTATYPNSLPLGRGSGTRRYPPPSRSQQPPFAAPQSRPFTFSPPPSQPSSHFPPSLFSPSQANGRDPAPHVGLRVESPGAGAGSWEARMLPTAEERAQRKVPFAERKREPEEESWVEEDGGDEEKKGEEEDGGGWNIGRSEMLRRETSYHSEIPTTSTPTQSFPQSRPSCERQPTSSSSTITAASIATGSSSISSNNPKVAILAQQLQEMQFRLGQSQHQVKIERNGKASTERALRAMRGFPPEQRREDILEWSGSTGRSTTAPANQSSSEPLLTPAQSPVSKSSRMTPPATSWSSSTPPPSNINTFSPQTPSQSPSSSTNSLPRGTHQRSSAWSTPTPSKHRANSSTSTARSSSKPSPGAWLSWDDIPYTENNVSGEVEAIGWDLAEEEQLVPFSKREALFDSVDDEDSGGWGVTHSEIVAASSTGSTKPQVQTQSSPNKEEARWGGEGMDEWAREQLL